MIYTVYHMNESAFSYIRPFMNEEQMAQFVRTRWNDYVRVATVQASSLEEAWKLTNSIEDHWSKNLGVDYLPPARNPLYRTQQGLGCSSMVGDVFEVNGKRYAVCSFGFTEVPPAG